MTARVDAQAARGRCNCIHSEGQPHLAERPGAHHWQGCPLRVTARVDTQAGRTLEDLLAAGEVEAALILKGNYTPAELDELQRVWKAGLDAGKQIGADREAALVDLLADAEKALREINEYAVNARWTEIERLVAIAHTVERTRAAFDAAGGAGME